MLYQPVDGWWLRMDVGTGRQWRWYEMMPVMTWREFDVRGSHHVGYLWLNMSAWCERLTDGLLHRSLNQPHVWWHVDV